MNHNKYNLKSGDFAVLDGMYTVQIFEFTPEGMFARVGDNSNIDESWEVMTNRLTPFKATYKQSMEQDTTQTSVECLLKQIEEYIFTHGSLHFSALSEFEKQAKQKHKDEIIYAVNKENRRCTQMANDVINLINSGVGELFKTDETIGEVTYKQMFEI